MRESFEYEGTTTGEYRCGLYATYAGKDYEAIYLGYGRFILYSTIADENFTFPTDDGRYLLQTDMRDPLLTRASEIRMVGIVKDCFENVMIRNIFEEGVVISTYNPRLAFQLGLEPVKELGFTGLVDRKLLTGIYEEKDYLWNPSVVCRQETDHYYNNHTCYHGILHSHVFPATGAYNCSCQGCTGINMFYENIWHISSHHISYHTTAHTSDHTDKDQQELAALRHSLTCGSDSYYCKNSQSQCIHDKKQYIPQMRTHAVLSSSCQIEYDNCRYNRYHCIDRILESLRWRISY